MTFKEDPVADHLCMPVLALLVWKQAYRLASQFYTDDPLTVIQRLASTKAYFWNVFRVSQNVCQQLAIARADSNVFKVKLKPDVILVIHEEGLGLLDVEDSVTVWSKGTQDILYVQVS